MNSISAYKYIHALLLFLVINSYSNPYTNHSKIKTHDLTTVTLDKIVTQTVNNKAAEDDTLVAADRSP